MLNSCKGVFIGTKCVRQWFLIKQKEIINPGIIVLFLIAGLLIEVNYRL